MLATLTQQLEALTDRLGELAPSLRDSGKVDGSEAGGSNETPSESAPSTMEPSVRNATNSSWSLASRPGGEAPAAIESSTPQNAERSEELRLIVQELTST